MNVWLPHSFPTRLPHRTASYLPKSCHALLLQRWDLKENWQNAFFVSSTAKQTTKHIGRQVLRQSEGPQFPNVPPFGDLTLLCRRNSSWSDILEAAGLWGDWAGKCKMQKKVLKVQDANHLLPQLFLSELNWGLFGTPFYTFLCPKTLNEKNSKTGGAEPSHRSFSWSSPTFFWKSKGMHLLNQNGFRGPKPWDLEIRALPSREGTQNTKGYKTKPGDQ